MVFNLLRLAEYEKNYIRDDVNDYNDVGDSPLINI